MNSPRPNTAFTSRLIRFFALLYPRAWRQRYGAEYDALLEDVRPDARTAIDVFSGALAMQIRNWRSWKIVAVSALLGIAVIAGLLFEMPATYISSAIIKVEGKGDPQDTIDRINTIDGDVESRAKLTQIVTTYNLYQQERSRLPLDDVIEKMKKNIVIKPLGPLGGPNLPAFSIQFSYGDSHKAQMVTRELTARFMDGNSRQATASPLVDHTVDQAESGVNLQILDAANLPMQPAYPNKPLIVGCGVACFLVMWGGLSAWRSVSARRFAMAGGSPDLPGAAAPPMTLPPFGEHLRKKAWKILATFALLIAIALLGYKLVDPNWESSAIIRVKRVTNAEEAGKYLSTLMTSVENRSSLESIIADENLYIRDQLPLEDKIEKMRKNIMIEPLGNAARGYAPAVRIRFAYRDRRTAQRVTQTLASRFVEQSSVAGSPVTVSILDSANLPETPVTGIPSVDDDLSFSVGLLFGAVLAALLAVIVSLFRRSPVPA